MKTIKVFRLVVVLTVMAVLTAGWARDVKAQNPPTSPSEVTLQLSNAFTYQGELKNNGSPVTAHCDFQFSLWDSFSGGSQIGTTESQNNIAVVTGLFTIPINTSNAFNPGGVPPFQGDMRFLQTAVRCPTGAGSFTTLTPRQQLYAAPYAMGLMPGTRMLGDAYQTLKIQNDTTLTGNPAAVTGEIKTSVDGVGVYGSNEVNTAGATGMGVWGRTWSPNGIAIRADGFNGALGVKATSNGTTISNPTIFAENTNSSATEPAGIALYALNHSADVTILARNAGTGDTFRVMNAAGNAIVYSVSNTGKVWAPVIQIYGGADLAENFPVSSAKAEPGTLMVIDPENPGQLKPSTSAYDSKVAGVVSGAGGVTPGMVLSQKDQLGGDTPIAIAGRVYVKATALTGAIQPGDLLTTSDLPGYAMKAADHSLAAGAVIGKAMTGLDSGTGLVLVLINLQ